MSRRRVMYSDYVLRSEKNGRFHIGYSGDIEVRFSRHNAGKVKATRYSRRVLFVYAEA